MNSEGFGSNGSAFEYTVAREGKSRARKRFLLLFAYLVWVVVFFVTGMVIKLILPLLCFIPLSLWIIIFFTWRWSKEEIKLTLFSGSLTVTRLYDGKNPKVLHEARIKALHRMEECTPKKLEPYLTDAKYQIIYATRNETLNGAYLAVWDGTVLVFEVNEKALKILKYYM